MTPKGRNFFTMSTDPPSLAASEGHGERFHPSHNAMDDESE